MRESQDREGSGGGFYYSIRLPCCCPCTGAVVSVRWSRKEDIPSLGFLDYESVVM
ncbi:hypothetical protein HYPBUDRAFT_154021, partial [Hyphopichia burtonii NRRL Y-1933]